MAERQKDTSRDCVATAMANVATPMTSPDIAKAVITDPEIIDQGRIFAEGLRQQAPLAIPGTPEASQAALLLRQMTARSTGLTDSTSIAQVTRVNDLQKLMTGPNAGGKAKEIVAALDLSDLHAGKESRIVNAPRIVPCNVKDIRLAPDAACKRDLLYRVQMKDGLLLTVPGAQVKTGSGRYIADSLVEMARKQGYGRTAYVDARFVNQDGSPRVADDAFTASDARKICEAKIKLRGIQLLDVRGDAYLTNLDRAQKDGLDPIARQEIEEYRNSIARSYEEAAVVDRVAGSAAMAAATAAVVSIAVQYATDGKVELTTVLDASQKAAAWGGAGAALDAAIYYAAVHEGLAPEAAKAFARSGLSHAFCLLAVGGDMHEEAKTVLAGKRSVLDGVAGSAFKAALDVLPLITESLGVWRMPVLVAAQVGGRWILAKMRAADAHLVSLQDQDRHAVLDMDQRIAALERMSEDSDRAYERAIAGREAKSSAAQ